MNIYIIFLIIIGGYLSFLMVSFGGSLIYYLNNNHYKRTPMKYIDYIFLYRSWIYAYFEDKINNKCNRLSKRRKKCRTIKNGHKQNENKTS